MERKQKKDSIPVEPMPRKQFLSLMRDFKKKGGIYIANDASEAFLKSKGVEACTLNSTTILFRKRPSRAAVYEELFHVEQFRRGRIDGTIVNAYENEIEAQQYLLDNAGVFGLTKQEICRTRDALTWYNQKLDEQKGDEQNDRV